MDDFQTLLLSVAASTGAASLILLVMQQRATVKRGGKRVVLDTCALIDGRIVDIARAGFVPSQLIIPRPVVRELQFLADQADSTKRERARFGLDVINELQQLKDVDVHIVAHDSRELVDEQLLAVAKQYGAQLYTTDYNLNKVAQVEGVSVLNVNELAQAIRSQFLPGEKISIKLVQAGQSPQQAVGYLGDGTMVVVENAKQMLGKQVEVEFTRVLQTQAGKMMFAVLRQKRSSSDKNIPLIKSGNDKSRRHS